MTNNNSINFRNIFISSLLGVLPFLLFGIFTIPSADDIFYHNYAKDKSTLEFLVHHYNTWTGRYFSNLMMAINPYTLTSSESLYPLMTYAVQTLFVFALFFFVKNIIQVFIRLTTKPSFEFTFAKENLNKICSFIVLVWLALFFHKMPRPTDSLYWFAGSSSHLIAMSFTLISVGLYLKSFILSKWSQVNAYLFIALLTIGICGSNETLMLQWIFIMFFGFVFEKAILNRYNFKILIPFVISIFSFLVVFVAPGNKIRAANLHGGHDILLLLSKPWGLVGETTVRYLSVNLILLLFWSLPLFKQINLALPEYLKEKKPRRLFYLFWLGLFSLTFVPSVWTMGGLPPRRVLNNTYLMILLLSFFIILQNAHTWAFLFKGKEKFDKYFPLKAQKIVFLLGFIFLFNSFFAWKDLVFTPKYLSSLSERKKVVLDPVNQETDVILPPFEYFPATYFYEDITTAPQDYRNLVFAEFYKLKSVKLSKPYQTNEVTW